MPLFAFSQSLICPMIRFAVSSPVIFRPNASTKLFSGSISVKFQIWDTHEIKEDRMIDQVILSWLHLRRCGKVNSEIFASLFDVIPTSRQSNYIRMEFFLSACSEGDLPARYFLREAGSSRLGSHVMNNGCIIGVRPLPLIVSRIPAILSNSSGQISGHRVNPKYIFCYYDHRMFVPECVSQRTYLD